MRTARNILVILPVLIACSGDDPLEPASAGSCPDSGYGGWTKGEWSSFFRTYEGQVAPYTDVLIEPDDARMRYVWSAELTNWGETAFRQPFLRSSGEPGEGGGIVVLGDATTYARIEPGQVLTLPNGAWIPVPPGWELNVFVPRLQASQKMAVTLGIVACEV